MIATWLLGGESLAHWLINSALYTVFSVCLGTIVVGPFIKRLLNPRTPGGVGDIPDSHGVKAWERFRIEEETERAVRGKRGT